MIAGAAVKARVIVDNDTGAALQLGGCGSLFQVALASDNVQPAIFWYDCLEDLTVPVGSSAYDVTVNASYLGCGNNGPFPRCEDGQPPKLPAGIYEARLYQNPQFVTAPSPITVRVTA